MVKALHLQIVIFCLVSVKYVCVGLCLGHKHLIMSGQELFQNNQNQLQANRIVYLC